MEGTPAITSTDKTTYVQGDTIQYHGTGFTSFGAVEACLTLDIVFVRCFANEPNSDLFGNVAGSLNIATDWTTGQQELWLYDVATGTQSAGVPLTITALNNQLVVWFDSSPQVKSSSPCGYLFGAMAQTASGLLVTSLHWDFGDGSTLDVPFSAQSRISDNEFHSYSNNGTYIITVTAQDNAGNSGTATVTLPNAISVSCVPEFPSVTLLLLLTMVIAVGFTSFRGSKASKVRPLVRRSFFVRVSLLARRGSW